MTEEQQQQVTHEMRAIIRFLETTGETAMHASLTGALKKGETMLIRQYNAVLSRLAEVGIAPNWLFEELADDAGIDHVGIAAKQLAAYLKGIGDEGGEYAHLHIDPMRDFGRAFRDGFAGFFAHKPPAPPHPPRPGAPPHVADDEGDDSGEESERDGDPQQAELLANELARQMQDLAERMRHDDLSPKQMRRLAEQMRRLAERQGELVGQALRDQSRR
ncbi:hypothetical protein FJZ36_13940 [Candidatus Poribacteria bacterium]|nr:hypothetical protein [Candidatus Poribacteria bacterium]